MQFSTYFTDKAVLQRNKPINVWGEGNGKGKVCFNNQTVEFETENGKWSVRFPPMPEGGPYTMTLYAENEEIQLNDIMVGEVFLAGGQSNMEHCTFATLGGFESAKNCGNPMIRFLTVARRTEEGARNYNWNFECTYSEDTPWQYCNEQTALSFSAIGFYFAELLQEKLGIAVGIISCNWGGTEIETWIDENRFRSEKELSYIFEKDKNVSKDYETDYIKYNEWKEATFKKINAMDECRKSGPEVFSKTALFDWKEEPFGDKSINWRGNLYKNMICRIAPYTVKGVLWYQGESNAGEPERYLRLFEVMVDNWRCLWNDNLPFYTVVIAPFMHYGVEQKWAEIMEQQINATRKIKNVYAVSTSDIGEEHNIHPINKKAVSEKLFNAVKTFEYGEETEYSGPIYSGYEITENRIVISFEHADGLTFDEKITELTAYDENNECFVPNAVIKNDKLIIFSEQGRKIKDIKLGFNAWSQINLKNSKGYTAEPFRILQIG